MLNPLLALYPGPEPADLDDYLAALTATLRQPGRTAAFAAVTPMARPCPIDAMARAPRVECLAGTLGGPAEIVMIQGAGHHPHAQFPTETGAAVLDFLGQTIRA